jgi:hypothetical protein
VIADYTTAPLTRLFKITDPFAVLFFGVRLAVANLDFPAVEGSVAFLTLIAVVALNGSSA